MELRPLDPAFPIDRQIALDAGPVIRLQGRCGAQQPAFPLVETTGPDHPLGEGHQGRREHRVGRDGPCEAGQIHVE